MDKHPIVKHSPDAWNRTLYEAAMRGDVTRMRQAVENGADVNFRTSTSETSLLAAIHTQKSEAVQFLLEHGADPNLADAREYGPLHHVMNHSQIANLLLDYGAEPNCLSQPGGTNRHGDSPLYIAADGDHYNVLIALLKAGADPHLETHGKKKTSHAISHNLRGVLDKLKQYEGIPRAKLDASLSKESLLRRDRKGYCALDNPVTYRQWPEISARLAEKGERFTKAEWMHISQLSRKSFLLHAVEARCLDAVVRDLNAHGERLEMEFLERIDPARQYRAMVPMMENVHVIRAVFTRENLAPLGKQRCRENLEALPENLRHLVPNRIALMTEASRLEVMQAQGKGGR